MRRAPALAMAVTMLALAAIIPAWADAPAPGLVAAYSFDEGSGGVATDTSGNGHTGTVTGATWTAGHDGGGLSFDGTSAHVALGSLGTFYNSAFTLEAWVRKQTDVKKDVAVVGSWAGSGPMLWIDHVEGHHQLTLGTSLSDYLDSGETPAAGEWQHLAATFDGTTARYYIDGTEVAFREVSGSVGNSNVWRIGAYGASPGGFFDGVIDNVRIYDRALTAAEVATDMSQPVPPPDTAPPSSPGTLTASGGVGVAALNWGAATDNVGVTQYNVHRDTSPGFTAGAANRVAQVTATSHTDTGLAAGTYFYKVTAEDDSGNVGAPSNEASALVVADTTAPQVSISAPASGATLQSTVPFSANASDNVAVAGVQFRVDGSNVGLEDTTSPYAIQWDTRGHANGSHALTAVARDTSGNTRTSSTVNVTVNNGGVSTAGLKAAYGLDSTSGTVAIDSSDNHVNGTTVGTTWVPGRFANAASFDGTAGRIDVPALGTFYNTAFTFEAWVRKQGTKKDVTVVGAWDGAVGPMIWVDHVNGRYNLTLGSGPSTYLDSGQTPSVGVWQHVAATYDGTTARFYLDGVEVANAPFIGLVGTANTWRIGAYGSTPSGFFDGVIDNVRIYDRALSLGEIQTDMSSQIQNETTPPTVTASTPTNGATGVNAGVSPTVTFSEPMKASTITSSRIQLKNAASTVIPATVSYNASTKTATLTPQAVLQFGATYTVTVKGGTSGVTDTFGNPLAADYSWSFTVEGSPSRVLVVTATANPFASYLGEILRNEGLSAFTTIDVSFLSPALLAQFDVVVLGNTALTTTQVTTLTNWVNAGGNLVAMRPDKKLAGLLGLGLSFGTRTNAYLKVNTSTAAGAGIVGSTIQFHGTADQYLLGSATTVATLYSNATTATLNPAVTLRSVGSSGGQAAAFTYDLARSVVYTRQGNPAWAGQERDGVPGIRPNDLFYGAKVGDVQPDWIDTNKIAIPQADEQQRLLLNLITVMERDKLPLPRFWYLPRGEKAVVVMSGDDHSPAFAPGGTASNFDRYKELSPPGCVVANWECVRSTSYIVQDGALSNALAELYVAQGFEIGLHPIVASCPTTVLTQAELSSVFDTQLAAFGAQYPSLPDPVSSRTHCVYWPDWASNAKVELAHGIRLDSNYYHYPGSWIGAKPGFLNGGGFPMRFADLDGTPIDVYQQNTNINDEATASFGSTIDTLLDNALGPQGYYGAFGVLIHNDNPAPQAGSEAIIASAQARGVPVISYKQMLEWTDGRNGSAISALSWAGGKLTFATTVAAGANGLQVMLPTQGPSGTLQAITSNGGSVPFTVQTVKGIQYAFFTAANATYQAAYS